MAGKMVIEKKNNRGFGLLEVLIAAMILVTVVGAAVALGSASLRSGVTSADKTTAYNLAQEGLETVRGMRDTAMNDGDPCTDWNYYIKHIVTSVATKTPYLLTNQATSVPSPCSGNPAHNNVWSLSQGHETIKIGSPQVIYTRKIFFDKVNWYTTINSGVSAATDIPSNDHTQVIYKVTAEITWVGANGLQTVDAETYLTDWKPIQ